MEELEMYYLEPDETPLLFESWSRTHAIPRKAGPVPELEHL